MTVLFVAAVLWPLAVVLLGLSIGRVLRRLDERRRGSARPIQWQSVPAPAAPTAAEAWFGPVAVPELTAPGVS